MTARSQSSSTSVLMIIILVITFPIWFAICAALFGVAIGLFGAAIGVVAALFGVIITIIVLPFKLIFGWGHWGWNWFPHFHGGFWLITLVAVAALIVRGRNTV